MVRGFWGDIINSPFFSYGEEVFEEPEKTRFYKQVNFQSVYSNTDISEYNVQRYIHKLEELTKYQFPFERIKHLLKDDEYKDPKEKIEKIEKDKKEAAKKEELTTVEEVTDEQAEEIEKEKQVKEEQKVGHKEPEDLLEAMNKGAKEIDLNNVVESKNDTVKEEDIGTRRLLKGFKMANIKIHLLSEDLDRLYTKQKYNNLFDIGVLSIHSANKIDEKMSSIFKKGAAVHVETADMLCFLKKDERAKFREKIQDLCNKAKWKGLPNAPFGHHMFFEVDKDESEIKSTAANTEDEDLNLDDLNL